MEDQTSDWTVGGAARPVEIVDFGLWIDGELFSEKNDTEGPTDD